MQKTNVVCPYCSFIFSTRVVAGNTEILICPVDEGGCDRKFVIDYKVKIEVEIFKIEEEN
jgi:hypothetical protein